MKFNAAVQKFVEWGSEDYQNRTLELYIDHLRRFSKYIDNKEIENISLFDDIIAYRKSLKARGISDNTINLSMIALRQLWKMIAALEKELKIQLPFLWNVIPHKSGVVGRSHPAVKAEDFFKMLKSIKDGKTSFIRIRDAALMSMLYDVGCRVSEMSALNRSSLNFTTTEWSAVFQTRKRRDHLRQRELTWTRDTQKLLLTYMDILKHYSGSEALWINRAGERLTIRSIQRIVKRYAVLAGLDPLSIKPHGFRHGVGQRLAESETHPIYIRDWLGHTDISGSNVYIKVKNVQLKRVYHEKIGDKREKTLNT